MILNCLATRLATFNYYLRYISKEQCILKHILQILLAKLTIIF